MVTKKEVMNRVKTGGDFTIIDEDMIASYYGPEGIKWDGAGIFIRVEGEEFVLEPKEAIKIPLSKFKVTRRPT